MSQPPAIRARFNVDRDGFAMRAQLDLPGRGVTALFGHSGSGKTTLLRAVAGLERHAGGYLEVNGETWQDDAAGLFVPTHRRALGYVFQEASLFPHLSVQGNLDFARRRAGAADGDKVMAQALSLLGIGHLLARRSTELSGGERQRVAIARALLTKPRLLLLDEPLASLDGKRKEEVLPYLERIHGELAIPMLYVSHSIDEVARLADHVVLLDGGRVLASGPAADTLARLDLSAALADDAGALVEGVVDGFDAPYQLLRLRAAGGTMHIAHQELAPGARLRLRILARDVSLTLAPQSDSSILNQLRATVAAEWPANDPAHVIVKLDAGGTALLARITRRSRDLLALETGKPVWAQVKAAALLSMH
ncbi:MULTISPECIES: molybdenum ABC transporter ATP-binding protein [unclassified Janthinobacterium]|uniref:molybdenum ABC transporter ATP-binding protein n=1 Tax=unclassified Janthinobacterium TaxID=2610881 RepID=UPI00034C712C|nr:MULTISPECIES: molybdenum ABC transporter ATP-binding protein [unclassified Janthinobacterium]MEC5161938.1 molybdate transport system ATP-binding protein [Janthinobacterium sp. CG_S6]